MACNSVICTILFGLEESSKITLFKDQVGKLIEAKIAKNYVFCLLFSVTLNLNISRINVLNNVILDNFLIDRI